MLRHHGLSGIGVGHHMHLAFFPAEAQSLLWGQSADVLIGSSNIFKAGIASKVDAGYLLRGRWPFSSGIHHCSWTTLGAQVPMQDGKGSESRYFLLAKEQYQILDTWRTAGLKGTGSADIEIREDVFVPEGLTVSQFDVARTTAAGLQLILSRCTDFLTRPEACISSLAPCMAPRKAR